MEKTCSKCGETKDVSLFGKRKENRDGFHGQCKACHVKKAMKSYHKHRQRVLDRARVRYDSDPEKYRAQSRKWRESQDSETMKEYNHKWHESSDRFVISLQSSARHARKHGGEPCTATVQEVRDLFTGFCEICGAEEKSRKLLLDHCHGTGQARGWLCRKCNSMLGFANDDLEILARAMRYLEENQP